MGGPGGDGVSIASVHTREHYSWGTGCDGWYLVKNEHLHVIQERMPPGTAEERHKHVRSQQFFYVLAGEARMEIEGRVLILREREGVWVRPGQAHRISNASLKDLELLVTSEPPSHGDRVAV